MGSIRYHNLGRSGTLPMGKQALVVQDSGVRFPFRSRKLALGLGGNYIVVQRETAYNLVGIEIKNLY